MRAERSSCFERCPLFFSPREGERRKEKDGGKEERIRIREKGRDNRRNEQRGLE